MDKDYCSYHPSAAAVWCCQSCDKFFGDCCIPFRSNPKTGAAPKCYLCSDSLSYLGEANTAQPFWEKVPLFFSYPSQKPSLIFLFSVFIVLYVFSQSILGVLVYILTLSVATKYGFKIIERVSAGDFSAPSLSVVTEKEDGSAFIKLVGIFLASGVVVGWGAETGSTILMYVSIAAVTFVFPSCVILLALTNSFMIAINPLALKQLIGGIGWRYILVWFYLFILSSSSAVIMSYLYDFLGNDLIFPVVNLVNIYFYFSMFSLMGYVVYQYQGDLGYTTGANVDHNENGYSDHHQVLIDYEKKTALATFLVYVKEGQHENARNVLRAAIKIHQLDVELNEKYHKYLLLLNDKEAVTNHGLRFIKILINKGDLYKAADIYMSCFSLGKLKIESAELRCGVANGLYKRSRFIEAAGLLNGLHKSNPDFPGIPQAYLLLAKIYAEHLANNENASKVIKFLENKYRSSSVFKEIEAYQKVLLSLG